MRNLRLQSIWQTLKTTFAHWNEDEAPRLGASLAFYTLLSLSPLLIVVIGIAGLVFGRSAAQTQLVDQLQQLVGPEGGKAIQTLLQSAQKPVSGIAANVVGFVVLLFGASGVFSELRDALNRIWHVKPKPTSGLISLLRDRIFSFGMVLAVGFLLLVSLVISAALAAADKFARGLFSVPPVVFEIASTVVSLGVVTLVIALLFKYLPDREIRWNKMWSGALATAVLFTIGRLLIGLYLGKASVASAYGAAGSLVALIVWVYYSAQIFFFGAEFTRVYAKPGEAESPAAVQESPQPTSNSMPVQVPPPPRPVMISVDHHPPSKAAKILSLTSAIALLGISFLRQRRRMG